MKRREPVTEEEDSDVEFLEVIPAQRRTNVEEEKESGGDAKEVENGEDPPEVQVESENDRSERSVVVEIEEVEEENVENVSAASKECDDANVDVFSESDELPCGLVRINRDAAVCIKEEPVILPEFDQEENMHEIGIDDIAESPIELEVLDSSEESVVELEVSDTEELAVELEVPDSDSEDDFTFCVELVTKLQNANSLSQLAEFPTVVELLRTYLLDRKHLTVVELDGYLFAHKRITDEEADEIGHAIEALIIVGMQLPLRPKIKLALHDLLATVEQLKITLSGLPAFLCPVVEKFKGYYTCPKLTRI